MKSDRKQNIPANRKGIAALILALLLAAALTAGGILAYFTDTETAVNTFTIGKISLSLQEPHWDPEAAKEVVPGETVRKDPQIINDGDNEEFVFMEVTLPYSEVATADPGGISGPPMDWILFEYEVNDGWQMIDWWVNFEEHQISIVYVYGTEETCTALAVGASTPPLFEEVMFSNVAGDTGLEGATLDITVRAYGIQTENVGGGTDVPADIWKTIRNQQGETDG